MEKQIQKQAYAAGTKVDHAKRHSPDHNTGHKPSHVSNRGSRHPLRHSIAIKFFASIFLCLLVLLVINWFLNNFALSAYYQKEKEQTLAKAFTSISTLYSQESTDITNEIYSLNLDNTIQITIWNKDQLVYDYRQRNSGQHINGFQNNGFNMFPDIGGMAKGTYSINTGRDARSDAGRISLIGRLDNGYGIVISTPVESVNDSVSITNQFLMYSGIVALLLGSIFVLLITRSFTRPIQQLSRVAESIANLDFSVRYIGRGKDEMAVLGKSINKMASALQTTVTDLKTANLQLQNDIELKTKQNEARRSFISNVSHELKTPISLIQTYAEGLHENIADNAESREFYCSVIEDEANKMSVLIKKMTMLMQLEAGNEELVIERFDIAELVLNMIQKYQPRFEQKQVTVLPPSDDPVYVYADEFLIENVLTNYLSNALNHVNDGGTISVTLKTAKNSRVRISVFNSGSHIPEEDLPRIWESFYKVDKARTRAYGGTGIGLSVVTAIMNAHHMPYGVKNRDSGVEFFIELPSR